MSRRWTMPGRCDSPISAISGYLANSPLTSVPSGLPAPGCTTRPAGLSTTITCSSSYTHRELDGRIGVPAAAVVGSLVSSTSMRLPELQTQLARRRDGAVDEHSTGRDERRGVGAAGVGDEGHDAVESLPGQRGGISSWIMSATRPRCRRTGSTTRTSRRRCRSPCRQR